MTIRRTKEQLGFNADGLKIGFRLPCVNVALDFHLKVRSDLMIIYTLKAVKKTNTSQGLRSDHMKCNLGSFSKDGRHTEKQTLRINVSLSDGM